jgi:hypothetical protein
MGNVSLGLFISLSFSYIRLLYTDVALSGTRYLRCSCFGSELTGVAANLELGRSELNENFGSIHAMLHF